MRTLALLAALLLLTLQVWAQSLEETADQVPAQDQPGAEAQDITISFAGDERSAREASKCETSDSLLWGSAVPMYHKLARKSLELGDFWIERLFKGSLSTKGFESNLGMCNTTASSAETKRLLQGPQYVEARLKLGVWRRWGEE